MRAMDVVFEANSGSKVSVQIGSDGKAKVVAGQMGHDEAKALADGLSALAALANAHYRETSGCHVSVSITRREDIGEK